MFDFFTKRLPWVVALVVALTLMGQAALAQPDEEIAPAAGMNADTVDGRHAVKSTGDKNKRKGKLMAFAASGYLPTNIVKGGVATVAALQSSTGAVNEADNPVHWNQIQGVPANVLKGDATMSVIVFETPLIAPGGLDAVAVVYPVGLDVETTFIPTAPGAVFLVSGAPGGTVSGHLFVRTADGTSIGEIYGVENSGGVASTVRLRAVVWNDTYLSPSAVNERVQVTFYSSPKKALEAFGAAMQKDR